MVFESSRQFEEQGEGGIIFLNRRLKEDRKNIFPICGQSFCMCSGKEICYKAPADSQRKFILGVLKQIYTEYSEGLKQALVGLCNIPDLEWTNSCRFISEEEKQWLPPRQAF